jgi:hypothetical protein
MTTMRSVEPLTGIDAVLAKLFPVLNGTQPEPGEHGTDRHNWIYVWVEGHGWAPDLPWYAGLPGMRAHAEAKWNEPAARAEAEAEAG